MVEFTPLRTDEENEKSILDFGIEFGSNLFKRKNERDNFEYTKLDEEHEAPKIYLKVNYRTFKLWDIKARESFEELYTLLLNGSHKHTIQYHWIPEKFDNVVQIHYTTPTKYVTKSGVKLENGE